MAWWNDFKWSRSGVTVKKTGARVNFDKSLGGDLAKWLPYAFIERIRAPFNVGSRIRVYALPTIPRYCYHLRDSLSRLGVEFVDSVFNADICLLYTSPSPRDRQKSRMPSSA